MGGSLNFPTLYDHELVPIKGTVKWHSISFAAYCVEMYMPVQEKLQSERHTLHI